MEDDRSSGRGILHVSAEELGKKAAQMQSGTEKLWQAIYQIESKLNRTKGYWYGAAGDSCRSAFAGSMDEVKQACSAISGYPGSFVRRLVFTPRRRRRIRTQQGH